MRGRLRSRLAAFCVAAAAFRGTPDASAQEDPPTADDPAARAVAIGREGVKLYEAGKWDEAYARFQEADALQHSPVFWVYQARCLSHGGRLLEARKTYERLLDEELPESAPSAWQHAQVDGRAELAALRSEIPSLVVAVEGAGASAVVDVAGRSAKRGVPLELDPGTYAVVVRDGDRRAEESVTLLRGERGRAITVRLDADAPAPAESATGPSPLGVVLLIGGGVGIAAGAVFGVVALAESGNAEDAILDICGGDLEGCPRSREGEITEQQASANTVADLSTAFFIGGAVVAAAGIVVLLATGDSEVTASARASVRARSFVLSF